MSNVFRSAENDCSNCELSKSRTNVVYPDVLKNSEDKIKMLIIGEAPGANEDKQGKPFVGSSGKILRKQLNTLPGTVIITNSVKCRPPKNRNPSKQEKLACNPFLKKEIDYYKPDFIILVGRVSSSLYFDNKTLKDFTGLSGKLLRDNLIPVLHPASTMYNAKKNKPIWFESWKKIRSLIQEKYPEVEFIQTKNEESEKKSNKSLDSWLH